MVLSYYLSNFPEVLDLDKEYFGHSSFVKMAYRSRSEFQFERRDFNRKQHRTFVTVIFMAMIIMMVLLLSFDEARNGGVFILL